MGNIFLLEGNWVQRQEILKKIKEEIGSFELYLIDEEKSYEYLKQVLMEFSCFDEKKLIIINNFPKIKAPNKSQARTKIINNLKKILSTVPSTTYLVFNNLNISSKPFIEEVKKYGKVYIFEEKIKKYKFEKWVEKYFIDRKKEITTDNVSLILNSFGINNSEIEVERMYLLLKKIENYVGGKKNVTKEDISAVCLQSNEFIIWNLFESFDEKNLNKSIKLFRGLFNFSKNVEQEIISLVHSIQWKYELLLIAKNEAIKGLSIEDICQNILKLNKLERSGSNDKITMSYIKNTETPIYSQNMIQSIFNGNKASLKCYSIDELLNINNTIKKVIMNIRSGCMLQELLTQVEFLFAIICGKIKKESSFELLENKDIKFLKELNNVV